MLYTCINHFIWKQRKKWKLLKFLNRINYICISNDQEKLMFIQMNALIIYMNNLFCYSSKIFFLFCSNVTFITKHKYLFPFFATSYVWNRIESNYESCPFFLIFFFFTCTCIWCIYLFMITKLIQYQLTFLLKQMETIFWFVQKCIYIKQFLGWF